MSRHWFGTFYFYSMKKFFTVILFFPFILLAQQDFSKLIQQESILLTDAALIINGEDEKERFEANKRFIPALVNALKNSGSFNYTFDSLSNYISILYPADNSFRIFSWQFTKDNGGYRYFGAIQMNQSAELKLFPLIDFSDSIPAENLIHSKLNPNQWHGCVYYNILEHKHKKKTYYTLFGWDGNDLWSTKKLMDVLHFENGKPVFGYPFIENPENEKQLLHRFIIQFRKDASVTLNYNKEEKKIIFDHLTAPEQRLSDMSFTFLPDGTYSGFKWKKGRWQFVEKIKIKALGDFDKPPVPNKVDFKKRKKQMDEQIRKSY